MVVYIYIYDREWCIGEQCIARGASVTANADRPVTAHQCIMVHRIG
jgi:hypothetical protein